MGRKYLLEMNDPLAVWPIENTRKTILDYIFVWKLNAPLNKKYKKIMCWNISKGDTLRVNDLNWSSSNFLKRKDFIIFQVFKQTYNHPHFLPRYTDVHLLQIFNPSYVILDRYFYKTLTFVAYNSFTCNENSFSV